MDRADAERVFTLVAEIDGHLRGRILSERWWLAWIASGLHMLLASILLQAVLWGGETRRPVLAGLLACFPLLLFLIIKFIHRRAGGQRTATERYLWWIWSTHILCTFGTALLEALLGLPPLSLAPVFALLAGFAFSIMAMLTDHSFLLCAAVFVGVAATMALLGAYQFLIYGGAWCTVLVSLGLFYRRNCTPLPTRRL
jgi:eukaryotic-like serine/threonine-protein kinase